MANERLNVPQIIDPEDLNKDKPDDQSVSTYLSFFYCPGSTGERVLLGWWNKTFARHLTNFTTDWHDANVLCEMVDHFVSHSKRNGNARRAMIVAERRLGVERTFTSEDIAKHKVDRLSLMVYVAQFQGLEVQQPYSNEEERIDDAAEVEEVAKEEEVKKATAVKRLSSYRAEEHDHLEEEEFTILDITSTSPSSPTHDEVIVEAESHDGSGPVATGQAYVTEIVVKQQAADELPSIEAVAFEPVVTEIAITESGATVLIVAEPVAELPSIEPLVTEPAAAIELLTAKTAYTHEPIDGKSDESEAVFAEQVASKPEDELTAARDRPIENERTHEAEMDPDEAMMNEALEETFQQVFESKALKRAVISISGPPSTMTSTPPPSISNEINSDNVSLSISDILQSEDQDVETDKEEKDNAETRPDRCLVTGRGLYKASVNTLASFNVDCSQAGRGRLYATVLSPRGDLLDLSTEAKKDGAYHLSFTPKVGGNHAINLEWGGRHIPGSPFACEVLDPTMCVASGPGLSRNIVGSTASFQVATRGAGNGTISTSIRGPTRSIVLMEVGCENNIYYYEYDPEEVGTYVIDIKLSGFSIPGSPFRVETDKQPTPMTADKVIVRDLPTQRVQVNQEVTVKVDASKASGGVLSAVAQGPSVEEACAIAEVAGEELVYAVTFTPVEIGEYTIYIDYGDCAIPDSPLPITVNDPSKCMVDTTSLREGMQRTGKPVSIRVLTNMAGEGDLTAVAKGLDQPCETRQESDGVWIVSYTPQNRGKYFIDIFFDNFPILKAPISFDVGDVIDQIILTKPVTRTGYYPTNKSLEFMILAPGINTGELTIAAHGTRTASTPTLAVSSSNETFTVLFTAPTPDDYKVEIAYKDRQVSGSPFILTVRDQPAPEKVVAFDPLIPHVTGKPIELVFDTSQAGEGSLAVSIASDAGESIATQLKEVSPSLYLVTFVPPKEGVYSAGVMWAGKHISGSPMSLKFNVQKKDPRVCIVFESNASLRSKLTAKASSKSGTAINLEVRQFERGRYQISFQPPKRDTYSLQVFDFEKEVNGSPFTVDLLKPSRPGLPQVEEGKGILSVMVTGEKAGPIKPTLEYDKSTNVAKIGFLSKQRDLYRLNIFWNHKLVQGSPFDVDLSRV